MVFKHIYLAASVPGYIISFGIRKPETSEIDFRLSSKPDLDGSDQEMLVANFRQVIKLVEPVVNNHDKFEN